MERIHAQAKELERKELTAYVSRTAQPFFAHFGFHVIEQRSPIIRGVLVPNALMRKDLVSNPTVEAAATPGSNAS